MAYVQGGLIEAVDFNTFRSQLQNVYGVGFGDSGYGQTAINVPTVVGGSAEAVKSIEWTALRDAIEVCDLHQQNVLSALVPPTADLAPNAVITTHDGVSDPFDVPQMLTNITSNALVVGPASTSIFVSRSSQTITNTWTNTAFTVVDLDFPTADAARYFFNSGGEIIIRASFTPNGTTPQNLSWQAMLNNSGSVVMNHNTTDNPGGSTGTPSAVGYYGLPNSTPFSLLFTASPPNGGGTYYYGANTYQILARVVNVNGANGDNGSTIRLRIDLDDNFSGGSDVVDGELTIEIDERRATTYLTIPSFTVTVQAPLNAS